jgi:outer membrane protein OmpA-like peptidoglycan-associated protein
MHLRGPQIAPLLALALCACASHGAPETGEGSAHLHSVPLEAIAPAAAPQDARPSALPAVQVSHPYELYFPPGGAEVDPAGQAVVRQVAGNAWLIHPARIVVAGHADRSGDPAHNRQLSERRARAVAAALVQAGVPSARISIQAYGDLRPAVPTPKGAGHPHNRRVVIRML